MKKRPPDFTVLGAAGFVGGHLVRYLKARGFAVEAPPREAPLVFDRPLGHVVYAIGLTNDYARRPFDTVEAHVSLFARLLREASFESVVYCSSTRLYDTGGHDGDAGSDLVLNPHNPRHLYDFSKGLGEALCRTIGADRARVARLSSVYADDLAADNFLHKLVARALALPHIALDTTPEAARDYVHIRDVCAALVAIAQGGKRLVYNVASGENVANRTLFELIEAETGCWIEPTRRGPVDNPAPIGIGALRRDFGLVPRRVAAVIPEIVAQHRDGARRMAG